MADLSSSSIASSYDQLISLPSGGGNGATLVALTDGNAGTTFGFKISTNALSMDSTNQLQFGDTGTYIYQSADGVLDLVSDTEIELNATTIDINGAVDISGTLALNDDVTIIQNKKIYFDSTDTYIYADTSGAEILYVGADDDIILQPDDDLIVQAGTTEYVRFDGANQRVGIGVTDPDSPLEVKGSLTGTSHVLKVANSSSDDTADCLLLSNSHASNPTTSNNYITFNDAGGTIDEMEGDGAGGVRFTGTAQATYSDSRIKTNIADLSSGLDKINALTPKTFDFTDEFKDGSFQLHAIKDWQKKPQVGFIAQEFKTVFPDLVQTDKREVSVDSVAYDGKDYSKNDWVEIESLEKRAWQFEAYLVKAIQELSASNDALKKRIEALESS